jgi:hypothetical protein
MGHMHTIPTESIGHTNESENGQKTLSREHVEHLKGSKKLRSALDEGLDNLLRSYTGTQWIKCFLIHKFR